VLTPKEYDEALLAADRRRRAAKPDARLFALAYLLLSTGIKKSETLGIKLEHLELDTPNGPQVFIKYATPANRYKERKITLPEDWIPAYEEYIAQYKPEEKLFPGHSGGWNICLKMLATRRDSTNTSPSTCAAGRARSTITAPEWNQMRYAKNLAYPRSNGASCSSSYKS
jgi:integrase